MGMFNYTMSRADSTASAVGSPSTPLHALRGGEVIE